MYDEFHYVPAPHCDDTTHWTKQAALTLGVLCMLLGGMLGFAGGVISEIRKHESCQHACGDVTLPTVDLECDLDCNLEKK